MRRKSFWVAAAMVVIAIFLTSFGGGTPKAMAAEGCHDLEIVFARGSGGERWTDKNYLAWKETIENKIAEWGIDYEFWDLDYEAIGIGDAETLSGAFLGAGDAYNFGMSVNSGAAELVRMVRKCPETKFVLGGYSQGAMVVSEAIHSIDAEKIIYAATFGDPKIYLPEGKAWGALSLLSPFTGSSKNLLRTGSIPEACKGKNLSEYRMYVPDCYAYEGMLGSYRPYQPLGYSGKLGTWCNKYDFFCSSYLDIGSHTAYVSDGLYDDASKVVAAKIAEAFAVENTFTSLHDTAILIDSSASMTKLIEKYKKEALSLAKKTLDSGGRIALYDYRDLSDPYQTTKRCDFETCDLETFEAELEKLDTWGGGDEPESLMAAAWDVMSELNWRVGATKSLVVLTDAGYHPEEINGKKFIDVVTLSKEIDPVNFYIITEPLVAKEYGSLATATDGRVVTTADDLSELTGYIMARYDSLPRVEEDYSDEFDTNLPILTVTNVVDGGENVAVEFVTDGTLVMVALNDAVLGYVEGDSVAINGLNRLEENTLRLVPLSETRRGNGEIVEIPAIMPKAPNTGRSN